MKNKKQNVGDMTNTDNVQFDKSNRPERTIVIKGKFQDLFEPNQFGRWYNYVVPQPEFYDMLNAVFDELIDTKIPDTQRRGYTPGNSVVRVGFGEALGKKDAVNELLSKHIDQDFEMTLSARGWTLHSNDNTFTGVSFTAVRMNPVKE